MEINITKLFKNCNTTDFSDSVANSGDSEIGRTTWNRALFTRKYKPLFDAKNLQIVKDYITGFGGWTDGEIDKWDYNTVQALLLQMIAGDIAEFDWIMGEYFDDWDRKTCKPDWDIWEKAGKDGVVSGNLFEGMDGEIYYSLY